MREQILNPVQLNLKGADAQDLLHRISTLNLKSLSLDAPTYGLILNPQGKIECGFTATKLSSDLLTILADDEVFLEILDRYTFGERYEIEKLPAVLVQSQNENERILSLIPSPGKEYLPNGMTNPLDVNLKSAIHDQKGCYPGQEVIEKIVALGSPAKRLCQLRTSEKVIVPQPLFSDTTEVGTLTSIVKNTDGFVALAILRRTHAKENLTLTTQSGNVFKVEKVSL